MYETMIMFLKLVAIASISILVIGGAGVLIATFMFGEDDDPYDW